MAAVSAVASTSVASFSGLRALPARRTAFQKQTSFAVAKSRTRCDLPTSAVVIGSTTTLLALGRFVFLPFQRDNVKKQGLPVQNGVTHAAAGDTRAQEVDSFLKTNDPAGFTLVDVLAWGALGHAVAYSILAIASNGYNPTF